MQTKSLFEYIDYKAYLINRLDHDPKGRGSRSAFAKAIHCQTAYVSNVLRGHQHFTPEQGEEINHYLAHNEFEADYFSLLLAYARAGTPRLRARIQEQLDKIKEGRFVISKRIEPTSVLSRENQLVYYSEWYYSAIHTLTSISHFNSVVKIADGLRLNSKLVSNVLEFLLQTGLVQKSANGFKIGTTRLHVGNESPLISKHHANWRLIALQSLQNKNDDLHYSSVVTLSFEDVDKIKEILLKTIKDVKAIIRDSKEETQHSLCFDFFKIV